MRRLIPAIVTFLAAFDVVGLAHADDLDLLKQANIPTGDAELVRFFTTRAAEKDRKPIAPEALSAAVRRVMKSTQADRREAVWAYALAAPEESTREDILSALAAEDRATTNPRFLLAALGNPNGAELAAYGIARYYEPKFRAKALAAARNEAIRGLIGVQDLTELKDALKASQEILKKNGIATDDDFKPESKKTPGLEFLRKQILSDADVKTIEALIVELGDGDFRKRDKASTKLSTFSDSALPLLRRAEKSDDAEVRRRAQLCAEEIEARSHPDIVLAAIRVLASNATPAQGAEVLATFLDVAPFIDRRDIEDQLLVATALVSARSDLALTKTLTESPPARRAVAAWAIGKVGADEDVSALKPLLDDPSSLVRLRAAQGMVALEQPAGVAGLISSVPDANAYTLVEIEDVLQALAKDNAPKVSLLDPATRAKAKDAWQAWFQKSEKSLDLAVLRREAAYEGFLTICENAIGVNAMKSKVWQRGRDGQVRWSIEGFTSPTAAHLLPNGRVLVAESGTRRVIERDAQGKDHWEFTVPNNTTPVAVQRLPNGNTFVATYNGFMEIAPDKTVVHNHAKAIGMIFYSADRTKDGKVVCTTSRGTIVEYDATTGNEVRTINFPQAVGGQNGIVGLGQGKYLLATPYVNGGQVREIDADGKTLWEKPFQGAFRAIKLPTGNVVVGSLTTRKVAELDREGRVVWEVTCQGRPWALQAR